VSRAVWELADCLGLNARTEPRPCAPGQRVDEDLNIETSDYDPRAKNSDFEQGRNSLVLSATSAKDDKCLTFQKIGQTLSQALLTKTYRFDVQALLYRRWR
jgi:hypothetical protein